MTKLSQGLLCSKWCPELVGLCCLLFWWVELQLVRRFSLEGSAGLSPIFWKFVSCFEVIVGAIEMVEGMACYDSSCRFFGIILAVLFQGAVDQLDDSVLKEAVRILYTQYWKHPSSVPIVYVYIEEAKRPLAKHRNENLVAIDCKNYSTTICLDTATQTITYRKYVRGRQWLQLIKSKYSKIVPN